MISAMMALLGLLAGGVVNVLADDLPRRVRPGLPHCPRCGYRYRPAQWLAVIRRLNPGACPACDLPTRTRAVLVEVSTALLFLILSLYREPGFGLVTRSIFLAVLVLITVTDLEHRLVLHVVTFPTMALALLVSLFMDGINPLESLIGAVIGFLLFYFAYLLGKRLFGPGALGFGDVTLATMLGTMLGLEVIFALVLGILTAGLWSGLGLLSGRFSPRTTFAYGPFLALAGMVMVIWGDRIMTWYLTQ